MKVLFFGDSITDAGRDYTALYGEKSYGCGYVKYTATALKKQGFTEKDIINRGINGNRIVDLYARIKADCWNLNPDVISILIGVNDVWHEIEGGNGVEIDRFEKVYRMLIEDTKAVLPNVKILLCEPFVLPGESTSYDENKWKKFLSVYDYAAVVKKLAKEYGLCFIPLQNTLTETARKTDPYLLLFDGVHPAETGAKIIAEEWLKAFKEIKLKEDTRR